MRRHRRRPSTDRPDAGDGGEIRPGLAVTADKHFVLDGHVADAFLVEIAKSRVRPRCFSSRPTRPGSTRDARTLVDNRRVASVALERVNCRRTRVLGGVSLIEATLDVGRAVVAAALCGVAEEAFARTMSYLKERKQFDRRIGSFQALQHRAAKMHIDIENSWSATLKALQALDADAPRPDDASNAAFDVAVAKAKASRTACEATAECLQMHGGIGMTDEFDIGLFLKRARVDSVLFGDAAFLADRVAPMSAIRVQSLHSRARREQIELQTMLHLSPAKRPRSWRSRR